MHARPILTGILSLLLGSALVTACDSGKGKTDSKADAKKSEKKADDKKADAKADDVKADDKKADDAKADDAKADDVKAADGGEAADGASGGPEAAAGDAGAAADGGDMKADDAKADDAKADDAKADDKKADDKKDAKKAEKKPEKKAEPAGPKIDAKGLYMKKCKSCHGVSGKADTKLGEKHDIADWTKPGWKGKWSLAKVEGIITNGKSGTKMKAFKDKLTADEIKAVAKYSRKLGK